MMTAHAALSIFQIEAREYQHFVFDAAARTMARNVIVALCIGIVLASFYAAYQRGVVGKPVRALLAAEALSPERAKTLSELSLDRNPFVAFELAHSRVLQDVIKRVEATDGGDVRYYIPEELKYRAEVRFDAKGNGVFALILTAVVATALAMALIAFLPSFLTVIDNLM